MTRNERNALIRHFKEGAKVGRHPSQFEAGYRRAMQHAQDAVNGIFEGREYDPRTETWMRPMVRRGGNYE